MNNRNEKNLNIITAEDGGFAYSFSVISILLCSIIYSTVLSVIASKDLTVFSSDIVIILNYILSPIAILLAIGILRYKSKKNYIKLTLSKNFSAKPLIASLLIGFGLMFGLSKLNELFVGLLGGLGLEVSSPTLPSNTPLNVILVIISVCVLPAVFEEFLFRGLILKSLSKTGILFATLISGALFCIFHMSPAQTVYQFVVGCIYSLIIIYGGNLLYTVIIHFLNNLYVVLNYYYFNIVLVGTADVIMTIAGILSLFIGLVILLNGRKAVVISQDEKRTNRINFLLGAVMGVLASLAIWIQGLING